MLLKRPNIDPNILDINKQSPLFYAIILPSLKLVKMLFKSNKLILPSDKNDINHIDNLLKENEKMKKYENYKDEALQIEEFLKNEKIKK